jgi:hypothetical protein
MLKKLSRNKILIGGAIVAVLVVAAIFMFGGSSSNTGEAVPMKNYFNEEYGITFDYPEGYVIAERDLEGSAQRKRHVITLISEDDAPAPTDGEGPPAITLMLVQNNIDKQTTRAWVEGSADSNFKQSPDQGTASVKVGGMDGLVYRWDGLYQGETTAAAGNKWIYAFSVTFENEDDDIVADYRKVINSFAYSR